MYISDQGLQAIHEERLNRLLAKSEQRRMLKQARDGAVRKQRSRHSWMALLHAVLTGLPHGRLKPAYKPSAAAER